VNRPIDRLLARALCGFARGLTGARSRWTGVAPAATQRVYYANHGSHGDFVLVWASLPEDLRVRTRPVAGADYWTRTPLRRYVARRVLNAVLIDRDAATRTTDPVDAMAGALESGDSLIVFPEGTRNTTDEPLLPFKSGLYHLTQRCPDVELIPVWIENSRRVMPKGAIVPVPLLCTLTFGAAVPITIGEPKDAFLARARDALGALRGPEGIV
jgi:1-acyl-sn-glycerol-3-phosphate acyltransferase